MGIPTEGSWNRGTFGFLLKVLKTLKGQKPQDPLDPGGSLPVGTRPQTQCKVWGP